MIPRTVFKKRTEALIHNISGNMNSGFMNGTSWVSVPRPNVLPILELYMHEQLLLSFAELAKPRIDNSPAGWFLQSNHSGDE